MASKIKTRSGLIAALDVGTAKTCCFIARVEDEGPRVVGIGHHATRGLRGGAVVDMAATETSILAAVHAAEQMAGETIREVYVNVAAGQPASKRVAVDMALNGHAIGDDDIHRVLGQGRARCAPEGREIIHILPLGYTIDGTRGIHDPRGMVGARLGVDVHVISADAGPLRNLATCIARAHLEVAARVVAPYAAGLAALIDDERALGATAIDMGGGTTGVAVFLDGALVHSDVVPIGGNHITNDIARGLATTIDHAERMKALFGNALASPADERETIDIRRVGEGDEADTSAVPRAELIRIVRPRIEETLELVRDRLAASGLERIAGRRLVLTGGASQLQGLREVAGRMLDKEVRLGRPLGLAGLAEATSGPAFATAAGLLLFALEHHAERSNRDLDALEGTGGRFGRIGRWLRENL